MPAEPKKQEEGVFRKPGVKHQRTEEPGLLRLPHDDLIKPERPADRERPGAGTVNGGNLRTIASSSLEPVGASSQGRDPGVVDRVEERGAIPGGNTEGVVAVAAGAAPAATADGVLAKDSAGDETWLRFQQHFGALLREEQMRLCRLVYEQSAENSDGWFDTTFKRVGELVGIPKRTAFRLVDRVEQLGFIRREKRESGREIVGVRLTFINPFAEHNK